MNDKQDADERRGGEERRSEEENRRSGADRRQKREAIDFPDRRKGSRRSVERRTKDDRRSA